MSRSTPCLGPECGGLIVALEAATAGDEELLRTWDVHGRPAFVCAFCGLGLQSADAEDATQVLLVDVRSAVQSGVQVRSERPWLATISRNVALRLKAQQKAAHLQLPVESVESVEPSGFGEDPARRLEEEDEGLWTRCKLEAAMNTLPEPYRTLGLIRIETETTNLELMEFLMAWSRMTRRAIGEDQARVMVLETVPMCQAVLDGKDAMTMWPRRFRDKNRWKTKPPPPFEPHRRQNRILERGEPT